MLPVSLTVVDGVEAPVAERYCTDIAETSTLALVGL
jgi:hypothetical protein